MEEPSLLRVTITAEDLLEAEDMETTMEQIMNLPLEIKDHLLKVKWIITHLLEDQAMASLGAAIMVGQVKLPLTDEQGVKDKESIDLSIEQQPTLQKQYYLK
jgi:hypothetical protein